MYTCLYRYVQIHILRSYYWLPLLSLLVVVTSLVVATLPSVLISKYNLVTKASSPKLQTGRNILHVLHAKDGRELCRLVIPRLLHGHVQISGTHHLSLRQSFGLLDCWELGKRLPLGVPWLGASGFNKYLHDDACADRTVVRP